MNDSDTFASVLVRREEGEVITARENREVIILAERDDVSIIWYRLGPGETGPDPHVHHRHTDAFYVLEGELGFLLGPDREPVRIAAGGLVAAPPNFVHTFTNDGDAEVTFLNLHSPDAGFAAYMRGRRDGDENASFDSAAPPDDGGLPLSEAVVAGPGEGERLGTVLLQSALPQLCVAEFDLTDPVPGPHLHEHDDQVDSFYVLDGELEVTIEDSRHRAGPGSLACVPRGVRHTFSHPGPGRVRFLNIHTPDCGFADFLRQV